MTKETLLKNIWLVYVRLFAPILLLSQNVATAGFFPSLLSIVADPTSQKSLKQVFAPDQGSSCS